MGKVKSGGGPHTELSTHGISPNGPTPDLSDIGEGRWHWHYMEPQ
jgi:hypothetical protein